MAGFFRHSAVETPAPVVGELVGGHYVEPYGYAVYRGAGTQDWLIACTSSGEGYFVYEDVVLTVGARDIVMIPPGTMHRYGTVEGSVWDFHWAHFIPRPYWMGWLNMIQGKHPIPVIHIEDEEVWHRIEATFTMVVSDSLSIGRFAEELSLNGLEAILLLMTRGIPDTDGSKLDPRIRTVMRYIAEHLSETLTVADLAAQVSLSPSRLSHLFKEQTQDSVTNTLIKLRLRQAARLLRFTSRKVTDIAHEVGFESSFYFTRMFTAQFGMAPTEYRKSSTADDEGTP